jgi:hypothetical protein
MAYAIHSESSLWLYPYFELPDGLLWQLCEYGADEPRVKWSAMYDQEALYFIVSDTESPGQLSSESPLCRIDIKIEPRRLWPCKHFRFDTESEEKLVERIDWVSPERAEGRIIREYGVGNVAVRIPFERIWWSTEVLHPVRINVLVQNNGIGTVAWCPDNPITSRLNLGSDNPADLGWLLFETPQPKTEY